MYDIADEEEDRVERMKTQPCCCPHRHPLQALFETAGEYVVQARLGSALLPGWPACLTVQPGPAAPQRCFLPGISELGEMLVGQPTALMLRVFDAFGNAAGNNLHYNLQAHYGTWHAFYMCKDVK